MKGNDRTSRLLLVASLALGACGGSDRAPSAGAPVPLDASWMAEVVGDPTRFTSLVDGSGREGWAAFHACRFAEAVGHFSGDDPTRRHARGRALWELALTYDDLARLGDTSWKLTFETWSTRSVIPEGSGLSYAAGLALLDAGDAAGSRPWLERATRATDPQVADAARALITAGTVVPPAPTGEPVPLVARLALHQDARTRGRIEPILAVAADPLIRETTTDPTTHAPVERHFYDPQVLRSLAAGYHVLAAEALGAPDPVLALTRPAPGIPSTAALLFGPVLTLEDLAAESIRAHDRPGTLGAGAATLSALGLATTPSPTDDVEWARQQVRTLDARLDPWIAERHVGAGNDGRALLDDLRLAAVFRSRVLLALAREAMANGHPRQAQVFAYLALDLEQAHDLTPINHPGLQAIIAEAHLLTGHTREALDALQVLADQDRALQGLDEVVGDLAILQGLDRLGDSKEN